MYQCAFELIVNKYVHKHKKQVRVRLVKYGSWLPVHNKEMNWIHQCSERERVRERERKKDKIVLVAVEQPWYGDRLYDSSLDLFLIQVIAAITICLCTEFCLGHTPGSHPLSYWIHCNAQPLVMLMLVCGPHCYLLIFPVNILSSALTESKIPVSVVGMLDAAKFLRSRSILYILIWFCLEIGAKWCLLNTWLL